MSSVNWLYPRQRYKNKCFLLKYAFQQENITEKNIIYNSDKHKILKNGLSKRSVVLAQSKF